MTRTGFNIPIGERENLAAQYECYAPGMLRPCPMKNKFQLTDEYESGGAGLYSCVDDYSLFADAMANGGIGASGARILKSETIDLMRTEQLKTFIIEPGFPCLSGPGYGYGLGVRTLVDKSLGQRSTLGEFGWDGAAGSYIMMDPAHGLSIFFAMHIIDWPKLVGCAHALIRDIIYEVLGL